MNAGMITPACLHAAAGFACVASKSPEQNSKSVQLTLQVGQFTMRLHDGVLEIGVDVAGAVARILRAIPKLLKLIHELTDILFIPILHYLVNLAGTLIKLLNTVLQIHRHGNSGLTDLGSLVNGLLHMAHTLLHFAGLHHDGIPFEIFSPKNNHFFLMAKKDRSSKARSADSD
jgi:hypothetical protein